MPNSSSKRPSGNFTAYLQIKKDRAAFNNIWQSSAFHASADPAIRALVACIHDDMKRLESVLDGLVKADKEADKAFAVAASVMADPEANTDMDY